MAGLKQDIDIVEAYEKIEAQIADPGSYSHNIVSSLLRQIDSRYGRTVANDVVEALDLEEVFNISSVSEEE